MGNFIKVDKADNTWTHQSNIAALKIEQSDIRSLMECLESNLPQLFIQNLNPNPIKSSSPAYKMYERYIRPI